MRWLLLASTIVIAPAVIAGQSAVSVDSPGNPKNPYFPLAIGNSWTFRCSVEGKYQFDKTVRLTATVIQDGVRYFRAELRLKRAPHPLVYYLTVAADGSVFSSPKPSSEGRELLITAAPKVGDRLGDWQVAARERIRTPALAQVEALRVENFSIEDPQLSAQRRAEWQGRFYAQGIGQVAEADGLDGECVLSKFRLAKSH